MYVLSLCVTKNNIKSDKQTIYLMFGNFIVEKLVQKGDDMIKQMYDLYSDFPKRMTVLKEFDQWQTTLGEAKFAEEKKEVNDSENEMNDDSSDHGGANNKERNGNSEENANINQNGQHHINGSNDEQNDDINIVNVKMLYQNYGVSYNVYSV